MQLKNYNNIKERTTFYASKKVTEQLGPNEIYKNLKKVIVISILDYNLTPLPNYITKTVRVDDRHRQYESNNIITYYYIQLKKFREQNPDMTDPINQWLALIDMERGDLLEMAKKNSKIIKEAYGEKVLSKVGNLGLKKDKDLGLNKAKRLDLNKDKSKNKEKSQKKWKKKVCL